MTQDPAPAVSPALLVAILNGQLRADSPLPEGSGRTGVAGELPHFADLWRLGAGIRAATALLAPPPLGLPATFEADLSPPRSLAGVLYRLRAEEATGLLRVEAGAHWCVTAVRNGIPVHASTPVDAAGLEQALAARGLQLQLVPGEALPGFVLRLLAMGVASPAAMLETCRAQAAQRLIEAFAWPDARARFFADPGVESVEAFVTLPWVELVRAGVRRQAPTDEALAHRLTGVWGVEQVVFIEPVPQVITELDALEAAVVRKLRETRSSKALRTLAEGLDRASVRALYSGLDLLWSMGLVIPEGDSIKLGEDFSLPTSGLKTFLGTVPDGVRGAAVEVEVETPAPGPAPSAPPPLPRPTPPPPVELADPPRTASAPPARAAASGAGAPSGPSREPTGPQVALSRPNDPVALLKDLERLERSARGLLRLGKPLDAVKPLERLVAERGRAPSDLSYLALAIVLGGDPAARDRAESLLAEVLTNDTEHAVAKAVRSRLLEARGRHAEAATARARALATAPDAWKQEVEEVLGLGAQIRARRDTPEPKVALTAMVTVALLLGLFYASNLVFWQGQPLGSSEWAPLDPFGWARRAALLLLSLAGLRLAGDRSWREALGAVGWHPRPAASSLAALYGLALGIFVPFHLAHAPLLAVLGIAAATAVAEEAFFRGFLARTLQVRFGAVVATVLSGLAFGLYQLTYVQVLHELSAQALMLWLGGATLLVGIPLSALYVRTRSLVPPLVAHVVLAMVVGALSLYR